MVPMRQRLLLVAGWAAAAVVASLVSTGAVAVAGGQVNDRPLRPLSASEVAALTEECDLFERAPCLRQLDESASTTTTVAAAPDSNSSLEGGEQGVSPVIDQASADSSEVASDSETTVPAGTSPDSLPPPTGKVVTLEGGTVGIGGAYGEVWVLWVIPSPGFAPLPATGADTEPGTVQIVFSDGAHQSKLIAWWTDEEGLIIEKHEGAVDQADD